MSHIYNSFAEIAMRILIILSMNNHGKDIDFLTAIDFISTYSKDFKINDYNLHGDNNYNLSGFISRRLLIEKSLLLLLKTNYIEAINSKNGINYIISEKQKKVCEKLNSTYSIKYKSIVKQVLSKYKNKSRKTIINEINYHIKNNIKGI